MPLSKLELDLSMIVQGPGADTALFQGPQEDKKYQQNLQCPAADTHRRDKARAAKAKQVAREASTHEVGKVV